MKSKLSPDQAEGLRRLFVADVRRMVAFVTADKNASGGGLVEGLASALAAQGQKVLLLDESLSAGDVPALSSLPVRDDLGRVLEKGSDMESAVVHTAIGVDLLAGGSHARTLPRPALESRIGLVNAFYRLAGKYDVVLVNAGSDSVNSRPSFAWACQDVIVLCGMRSDEVTHAYGHIKLLHQSGERRFHLLFGEADPARARVLYKNVATVCRRHLHLMPEYLGALQQQDSASREYFYHLAEVVQSWPLPEQKTGHFPALMQRLLRGASTHVLQTMAK
jgi:flagellar biosynthesis protein FlhG